MTKQAGYLITYAHHDSIWRIPSFEERCKVMQAIVDYNLTGTYNKEDLSPHALSCLDCILPYQDYNKMKYEHQCKQNRINGKKGGRPKKKDKITAKPNGFLSNTTELLTSEDLVKTEKPNKIKTNIVKINKIEKKIIDYNKPYEKPESIIVEKDFKIDMDDERFADLIYNEKVFTDLEGFIRENFLGRHITKRKIREMIKTFAKNQGKLSDVMGYNEAV